jgi:hypothetical protein
MPVYLSAQLSEAGAVRLRFSVLAALDVPEVKSPQ